MKIDFFKAQGCGNDYIYIDCFDSSFPEPEKYAVSLSDRHFGIGGDGLVLICPSSVADAKMRMFNNDGSEGNMCGNAIRCVGKYLYESGRTKKLDIEVETRSGIKKLTLIPEGNKIARVRVDMGKAIFDPKKIPVLLEGEPVVNRPVMIGDKEYRITCVSMGNPHCVLFLDSVAELDLAKIGPAFESNPLFPQRVNTEFIWVENGEKIHMRVWERGSGETLACGTGACAAVAAGVLCGYCPEGKDIRVVLSGGELTVNYTKETVMMEGACVIVFSGTCEI